MTLRGKKTTLILGAGLLSALLLAMVVVVVSPKRDAPHV